MFETSMFVAGRRMSRRTKLVLLPLSVLFHAAVIVAAISVATWTVDLPAEPPPQMQSYQLVTPVPTPPPPPPPNQPADRPQHRVEPEPPKPDSAPSQVPDKTPDLPKPPDQGPSAADHGNADGVVGGVDGGQIGGVPGGVVSDVQPKQPALNPIVITADVEPPKILRRVAPVYPEKARIVRATGTVIVQCIIDRTGTLRDIRVLSVPNPWLDQAAIDAIQKWRFSPGKLRGKPVDVYFTLTVRFDLQR